MTKTFKNNIGLVIILLACHFSFAQKKTLQAIPSKENITIDGKLDETSWNKAPIAGDFFSFEPENGTLEPKNQRSEVKIIYNNNAIYIGAVLYDDSPEKIQKEITQRDNFGTADPVINNCWFFFLLLGTKEKYAKSV